MPELWDLYAYDQARDDFIPTGATAVRGTRLPDGTYHRVVHAWIRNHEGKYLISQHCAQKSHALCWEPTGGSVLAGETSLDAACREVKEELGILLPPEKGQYLFRGVRHYEGCDDFVDVWLFDGAEVPQEEIKLQTEEVNAAMWVMPAGIHALRDCGFWMPWQQFDYLDRIIGPNVAFDTLPEDEAKALLGHLHNTAYLLHEQGNSAQSFAVGSMAHQRAAWWMDHFSAPEAKEYWQVMASDAINWARILEENDRLVEAEKYYDAFIAASRNIYQITHLYLDAFGVALGYHSKARFLRRHDLMELSQKEKDMARLIESIAIDSDNVRRDLPLDAGMFDDNGLIFDS